MSDLSRHLPLSQRNPGDESGVSGDWSTATGAALLRLADLLTGLGDSDWSAPCGRPGWTVRETVGHLVWRLGTTPGTRAAAIASRLLRRPGLPSSAVAAEAGAIAQLPQAELVARVRAIAADALAGGRRRRLADLAVAVLGTLDVGRALGRRVSLDPAPLGAVALARALSAPLPIRAVVGMRSLVATDADWVVGRGTPLRAPAANIVLFLYGRTGLPDEESAAPGAGTAFGG